MSQDAILTLAGPLYIQNQNTTCGSGISTCGMLAIQCLPSFLPPGLLEFSWIFITSSQSSKHNQNNIIMIYASWTLTYFTIATLSLPRSYAERATSPPGITRKNQYVAQSEPKDARCTHAFSVAVGNNESKRIVSQLGSCVHKSQRLRDPAPGQIGEPQDCRRPSLSKRFDIHSWGTLGRAVTKQSKLGFTQQLTAIYT